MIFLNKFLENFTRERERERRQGKSSFLQSDRNANFANEVRPRNNVLLTPNFVLFMTMQNNVLCIFLPEMISFRFGVFVSYMKS